MTIYNIQQRNLRNISKYPFTQDSSLALDNIIFPSTLIKSLNIHIQDIQLPVYWTKFSYIQKHIQIAVADKNLETIGNIFIYENKQISDIRDNYGLFMGTMYHQKQLFIFLSQYIKKLHNSQVQLDPYSFKISGDCLTCIHYSGCVGVKVNQNLITKDIDIYFQNNIVLKNTNTRDSFTVNTFGNYNKAFQRDVLKYINGINVQGCTVTIKHTALGNLRVVTNSTGIILNGVKDG